MSRNFFEEIKLTYMGKKLYPEKQIFLKRYKMFKKGCFKIFVTKTNKSKETGENKSN